METVWQFVAVAGTAASIAGGILAWQARDTRRLLERMEQTNRASHEGSQGMLARMDRANEQRAEVLRTLLERR
jgi:hypothetical protein